MAAADIRGIQSQGVMAQVKHAAVYNQETNRNAPADNAIVDTRTLQEIYLPGVPGGGRRRARPAVGDVRLQHRQRRLRLPEPVRC